MRKIFCLLLCVSSWLAAQELPPVATFDADAYGAGTQNWMLSQDERDVIYAANNQGVLEFDGQRWTLCPSPNETIIRSVFAHGDHVYSGSYMQFGHWLRAPNGQLKYHSLSDSIAREVLPDEQFWNIFLHEGHIVFQSLQQFFLYHPNQKTISVLTPPNGIGKAFPSRRGIYFTDVENRLHLLSGGLIQPLEIDDDAHQPIVHVWEEAGKLYAQSAESGCFLLLEDRLVKDATRHRFLDGKKIYSATSLRLGGSAFGTISDGVYIVDRTGSLRYHLTQVDGLTNNTVLSLFEDRKNNLWAGTDNGISYINLSSPFRKYTDITGRLGTVHASAIHQGYLYLGSNQGLFSRRIDSDNAFTLVPGTKGQVWTLYKQDDTLLGGHDKGAFTVKNNRASFLFNENGVWTFTPVPGKPNKILQGTYKGIWLLEKQAGSWRPVHQIEGFDFSSRFQAMPNAREVYVSHEYRGVFGLQLDEELKRVTSRKDYATPDKGKNAGIISFRGDVYYYSADGLFQLKGFQEGFAREDTIRPAFSAENYTSGKMTVTEERLWFFGAQNFSFLHPGSLTQQLQRQTVPVPAELLNAKSGYENISSVGTDTLLIGTADGYLLLAIAAVPLHQHELYLSEALAADRTGTQVSLPLSGDANVSYTNNNLTFSFSVPAYHAYFQPYFRHRLAGLTKEWTDWTTEPTAHYSGLPFGDYTLEVESLLGRRRMETPIVFPFTVQRPWYASYPIIGLYLIGAAGMIYLLHRTYTRHYRRKQIVWRDENERKLATERREAELALTRINNERLEADITAKNREMANSTMNLVRKNELLQRIKAELLSGQDPQENIRKVVITIDQNINEAETWDLFRDAFENTDQGFFRKIKTLHPELTPTDLKLCAYLRLNLSSKEIAPLLNISVRSVEVKRYRLRKKMKLQHEAGLADYILGL